MDKQWSKVLEIIKDQVNSANFRTWFAQTNCTDVSGASLTISVPSTFIKDQLQTKLYPVLESAIQTVFGKKLNLSFKVDPSMIDKNHDDKFEFQFISTPSKPKLYGLNSRYTLENFVVGFSNNLAYAAAQAVIKNPGLSYNPLFIYGGTGVGKTHLMHGIGNTLASATLDLKIIYCSSEKFTNDFIESIQGRKTNEFRAKYRLCDLLLIDDIQFIAGRDSTQEEFFHTFNELQSKNSQIILTSDRPPNNIPKLESRLASRFQGGLMVDIQLPDFDTRVAILKAKCSDRGEEVSEDILTLIAENMPTNARELEGKLIQIIQNIKLKGLPFTKEVVVNFLDAPRTNSRKLDYKKVLSQINQYFNIRISDITGPRRKKGLVFPRHMAMHLLYYECKLPYGRIGEILGGRDHTTIMHGVEKINTGLNNDREIQKIMIELKQILQV